MAACSELYGNLCLVGCVALSAGKAMYLERKGPCWELTGGQHDHMHGGEGCVTPTAGRCSLVHAAASCCQHLS